MATWGSYFASYVKKADVPPGSSPAAAPTSLPTLTPVSTSPEPAIADAWMPVEIKSTAPTLIAPTFKRNDSTGSIGSGKKLYDIPTTTSADVSRPELPQRAASNAARVANLFGYAKGGEAKEKGPASPLGVLQQTRAVQMDRVREEERKGGIVAESVYGLAREKSVAGGEVTISEIENVEVNEEKTGSIVVGLPADLLSKAIIVEIGNEQVVETTVDKIEAPVLVKEDSNPQVPISLPVPVRKARKTIQEMIASRNLIVPDTKDIPAVDITAMQEIKTEVPVLVKRIVEPEVSISLPTPVREAPRTVEPVILLQASIVPETKKAPVDTIDMLEANLSSVDDMLNELSSLVKPKTTSKSQSKKKGASALDMLDFFASQAEDTTTSTLSTPKTPKTPKTPSSARKIPRSAKLPTRGIEQQLSNAEKIMATPSKRNKSLEMLDFFAEQAMSTVADDRALSQQLRDMKTSTLAVVEEAPLMQQDQAVEVLPTLVGNKVLIPEPRQVEIEKTVVPAIVQNQDLAEAPAEYQAEEAALPVIPGLKSKTEETKLVTIPAKDTIEPVVKLPIIPEAKAAVEVPVQAAEPVVKAASKWTFGFGRKQAVLEPEKAAIAPLVEKTADEKPSAKTPIVVAPAAIAPPSFNLLDQTPAASKPAIVKAPVVVKASAIFAPPSFDLRNQKLVPVTPSTLILPADLAPKIISPHRRSASAALSLRFPMVPKSTGLSRSNTVPSRPSYKVDAPSIAEDNEIDIDFRERFLEYEKQAEKIQLEKEQMEAESERMAMEMLMFQQEADRIASEEEAMRKFVESLETERLRDEENEERKRREREARLEAERKERERIENERLEAERLVREEAARLVREEEERVRREKEEADRITAEAAEKARLEKEEAEQLIARTKEREKRDKERKEAQQRALVEEETKRNKDLEDTRKRKVEAQREAERIAQEEVERLNADMLRYIAEAEADRKNAEADRFAQEAEEDRRFMEEELERERQWEDAEKEKARKLTKEAETLEDERLEQERLEYEEEQETFEDERLEDERLEQERLEYEEEQERLEYERFEEGRSQFEKEQNLLAEQREAVQRRERQERRKAKEEAERLEYEIKAAEEEALYYAEQERREKIKQRKEDEDYYAEQDRLAIAAARQAELEEDEESEDEIVKAEKKIKEAFAGLAKERGESPNPGSVQRQAAAASPPRRANTSQAGGQRQQDRGPAVRRRDEDDRPVRNNTVGARPMQPAVRGDTPKVRPQIKGGLPSGPRRRQ